MTGRIKRLFYVVLGVFALLAISLVLVIALRPQPAPPPVMDQSGAEAACVSYVKARVEYPGETYAYGVTFSQTGSDFVVKVTATYDGFEKIQNCHVRADGGRWVLVSLVPA
jgi:hypothetical protein